MSGWVRTTKNILMRPRAFFRNEQRRDGFGYPLKFAAVSLILSGLMTLTVSAVLSMIRNSTMPYAALLLDFVGTITGGMLLYLIFALSVHMSVQLLFGRQGLGKTFAAVEYSSAVFPIITALLLAGYVSGFGMVFGLIAGIIGIYGVLITYNGVREFHRLNSDKARLAVALPVILLTLVVIMAIVILMTLMGSPEPQGPPPAPGA